MPADRADIHVPSECREMIRAGALVAVNHSGGKDSQAMAVLLSRIVLPGRLVAVHAPLGEVEWPGTVDHIRATLPAGVPLILAPVTSGKTLLHSIEERGRFPSPSPCRPRFLSTRRRSSEARISASPPIATLPGRNPARRRSRAAPGC